MDELRNEAQVSQLIKVYMYRIQSEKSGTIRESNQGPGVRKAHYA